MATIWAYVVAHQTLFTLGAYMILSSAVGSLPMPDNTSGKFYRWFFQFSNTVAANLSRVSASFGTKGQQPPAPAIEPPAVPVAQNPIVPKGN
jgi:hypothetical protein